MAVQGVQVKIIAGLIGAVALGSAANAATVYDAFTSFDGTQGAGGFSYLKLGAVPGDPATLLTAPSGACIVTAASCLQGGGSLPGVYKSGVGGVEGTYTIPTDQLLVHPGNPNPIAILFRAPSAGDYDYVFTANVLDRSPTGVAIIGLTNLGGEVGTSVLTTLGAARLSYSVSGAITLAKDDLIGVIVSPAGNYSNDSTGINFTLTTSGAPAAVPEPAAWGLMILGFGGVGGLMRRRRLRGPVPT